MFGLIDLILLAVVALFVLVGWHYGFIQSLGNLIGLILGVVLGGHIIVFLQERFSVLEHIFLAIVIFVILALLISWLIGWVFKLIDKLYKILAIIPFLKPINKLAGALLGLLEGALFIVALAYFASTFMPAGHLQTQLLASPIIQWFDFAMDIASWALPEVSLT